MISKKSITVLSNMKLWGTATVGAKGQVVIPAEAREVLGISEGDKLVVMSAPHNKGAVLLKAEVFEQTMREMSDHISAMTQHMKGGNKK